MLRRARITAGLLTAMLVCAVPASASAATPVSDQYQSAPAPVIPADRGGSPPADGDGANPAGAPAAAGSQGAATASGRTATPASGSRAPQAAATPLRVTRGAGGSLDEPLDSSGSLLPLVALGLLALGVALAAVGRGRRSPATP